MSSLTGAPERRDGQPGRAAAARRRLAARPDALTALLVAALLVAASFAMGGGGIARTTWPSIALALLGAAAVAAAAVAAPPERRLWGGVTLALFGALVVLAALSIAWSIVPSRSWEHANLLLGYLGAFAGAMAAARLAPGRWSGVLGGVVLAALVITAYALLTKVFPGLAESSTARVRAPFSYWNAVGLMAALGVPGALWLGARRDGHAALRALSVPVLALLLIGVLLSQSRGSLVVTGATAALWFALVPLRLRGAAVLVPALVGAGIVGAWALANDALSLDGIPLEVRDEAGGELGLLLVAVLVLMLLAGLGLAFATARATLRPETRRTVGAVLLIVVALVPIAAAGRLALSDRGLGGSVSDAWTRLTDPNATQPGNDPSRLAEVSGVRARYWDDAFEIWSWDRLKGLGADTYGYARRPIQVDFLRAGHAHGYVPQTLADLGLIGLGTSLLLLAAWLGAAVRATELRPRRKPLAWAWAAARARDARTPMPRRPEVPWTPERIALVSLVLTAVAFGLHSAVDWTWFIPGTAIAGLLCAGWVAARGPLTPAPPPARVPRPLGAAWPRLAVAALALVAGLAAAWSIWQPLRASNAEDAAFAALDAGRPTQALAEAQDAVDLNPLAIGPLFTLATVQEERGLLDAARATLERAVRLQPATADAWFELGVFQLGHGDAAAAARTLAAAVFLDPRTQANQTRLAAAQAQAGVPPTTPPAPPAGTPPAAPPTP